MSFVRLPHAVCCLAGQHCSKGNRLTAKHRLNVAFVYGALLMASFIGAMAESWFVFLTAAAALIAMNIHDGSIRR